MAEAPAKSRGCSLVTGVDHLGHSGDTGKPSGTSGLPTRRLWLALPVRAAKSPISCSIRRYSALVCASIRSCWYGVKHLERPVGSRRAQGKADRES